MSPVRDRLGTGIALLGVVLLGAFLRLDRLHGIPPGLFFDEAANLFDIGRVLGGAHPLYFPANNGREPLYFYWAALFARVWGLNAYALRLSSAVVGILTLLATFFCAREAYRLAGIGRTRAEWYATAATAVLATTYMHVHFSRWGLRTVTLPLVLALSLAFLLRGIRTRAVWCYVAAGILGGISTYTYISSRVAPALLAVPPLAGGRRRLVNLLAPLALVLGLWVVVSVPLGVYYLRHPGDVQGHTDDVSILNPANNHGDPVGAVARGVRDTFLALSVRGSGQGEQNLPGRPIFDPIQSTFFLLGLIALGRGVVQRKATGEAIANRRIVAALLVAWIVDQALPSVFSVNPPGYVRITGVLPPLAIVAGLGVGVAFDLLRRLRPGRWLAPAAVGAALLVTTVRTYRDYFLVWGPSEVAFRLMMADKADSAARLQELAKTDRVFLAPLYAKDNTVRYLTQGVPIQSFDIGKSLVLPTDRSHGVDYLFPVSDRSEADFVTGELPPNVQTTRIDDPTGRFPLLIRLSLSATALPSAPTDRLATFQVAGQDSVALVDARLNPSPLQPGGHAAITLRWLDLQPLAIDYTAFVHLRDRTGQTVAQLDRQPTDGSYPTSVWRPGDLILDRYTLDLPPRLPPGQYQLVLGLYELKSLQRLSAQAHGQEIPAAELPIGTITVGH